MIRVTLIILLTFSSNAFSEDCLQQAASYADKICGEIKNTGNETVVDSSGGLLIEIKAIIKTIFAGIGGGVKKDVLESEYDSVLREHLAGEKFNARACRIKVSAYAGDRYCREIDQKEVESTCLSSVKIARVAFLDHRNLSANETLLPGYVKDVTSTCGAKGIEHIDIQISEYIRLRCDGKGSPPPKVCDRLKSQLKTNVTKVISTKPILKPNGELCAAKSECSSGYCMPGPSKKIIAKKPSGGGNWYCTSAKSNCALPETDGAMYGQKIRVQGLDLICKNPQKSGYWAQFLQL